MDQEAKPGIVDIKLECDPETVTSPEEKSNNETLEKFYKCSVCSKKFKRKSQWQKHMYYHKKEKCHKCEICSKSFRHYSQMIRHLRTHTGEKPFQCCICENYYTDKSSLRKHLAVHTGEKPYKCNLCEKTLKRRVCLIYHVKVSHHSNDCRCRTCVKSITKKFLEKHSKCILCSKNASAELPQRNKYKRLKRYICEFCNKVFRGSKEVKIHGRIHTGEKPFKCKLCEKSYTRRTTLINHIKTCRNQSTGKDCQLQLCTTNPTGIKHEEPPQIEENSVSNLTSEQPYKCQICYISFKEKNDLTKHYLIHSNERKEKTLNCPICGKSYFHTGNFERHLKFHKGEKQFLCDICKSRFSSEDMLVVHSSTHIKLNNKYKCELCDENTFKTKSLLYNHLALHAKGNFNEKLAVSSRKNSNILSKIESVP